MYIHKQKKKKYETKQNQAKPNEKTKKSKKNLNCRYTENPYYWFTHSLIHSLVMGYCVISYVFLFLVFIYLYWLFIVIFPFTHREDWREYTLFEVPNRGKKNKKKIPELHNKRILWYLFCNSLSVSILISI